MEIHKITDSGNPAAGMERMPVLFLGHGNPMNAIEVNEFVEGWRNTVRQIPKPKSILCISAHWETDGTKVTAMEKPRTIHDFGGFPQELYDMQYPAPGNPGLANEIKNIMKSTDVGLDETWGLDHGCWSVLKHLYPGADVPIVQMSLDSRQPPQYHYDLAKELSALRRKGVLIVGSGNMVHNLSLIAWERMDAAEYGYDWALEAAGKMKELILAEDYQPLIHYESQGTAFQKAVPTPEHYLPLLYALALKEEDETVSLFNDKTVAGSLAMTSLKIN
jgi:4,5-DOPA dioxygenase extradiol